MSRRRLCRITQATVRDGRATTRLLLRRNPATNPPTLQLATFEDTRSPSPQLEILGGRGTTLLENHPQHAPIAPIIPGLALLSRLPIPATYLVSAHPHDPTHTLDRRAMAATQEERDTTLLVEITAERDTMPLATVRLPIPRLQSTATRAFTLVKPLRHSRNTPATVGMEEGRDTTLLRATTRSRVLRDEARIAQHPLTPVAPLA